MSTVMQYLKMGYEIIGRETLTASSPPTPTTLVIPNNIRKVVMVVYNTSGNLVFGAVENEDSPTAVEIPNCDNEIPQRLGPWDSAIFPYHFYCTADSSIRILYLGTEQGDLDAVNVR